jgi:large subunit ribosomal protein L13
VQKTYIPKDGDVQREWFLIDANDQTLGRLASRIAELLMGKHKPTFTPGMDTGDFVVVINAKHITVTGNKLDDKIYYRYTGYPGGIRQINLRDQLAKHPDRVISKAVWGMLPHNKLGRRMLKKLKVYGGPDHPHEAQQPKTFELD